MYEEIKYFKKCVCWKQRGANVFSGEKNVEKIQIGKGRKKLGNFQERCFVFNSLNLKKLGINSVFFFLLIKQII